MFKKLITLSLICSAFFIFSCEQSEAKKDSEEARANVVKDWPVLKVATEFGYIPFEYRDEMGNPLGFDIDIILALAEKMQYKVDFHDTPWSRFYESLDTSTCDLWISGISITPEREEKVSFSEPYLDSFNSVYVLDKPEHQDIQKFEDLKDKIVSAPSNTNNYAALLELKGNTDGIVEVKNYYTAFKRMAAGQVDATMGNSKVMENLISHYPNIKFRSFHRDETASNYAIAVKKGNVELLQKINKAMAQLKSDGTYDKIHNKWFGSGQYVVEAM